MSARALLNGVRVAPSILSADFARLGQQVGEVLDAGARIIHVDVMDGHFVPPITMGPIVVGALADQVHAAGGMLDVHLMIERPERHVSEFVKAGADSISFHSEATPHIAYAASLIAQSGAGVGVAINPATAIGVLEDVLGEIDMVLCMTVNPGWGGQQFIARSPEKIGRLRRRMSADIALQVDGGIDPHTAPVCADVGANVFVAGSAIFSSGEPGDAYRAIAHSVNAE
ncbi:MAG TPA: ribulose-phosphate 3-epimerase [Solirubrobacteraceae bacterium]|jgi:ribulose-phosphate 3-epimerase